MFENVLKPPSRCYSYNLPSGGHQYVMSWKIVCHSRRISPCPKPRWAAGQWQKPGRVAAGFFGIVCGFCVFGGGSNHDWWGNITNTAFQPPCFFHVSNMVVAICFLSLVYIHDDVPQMESSVPEKSALFVVDGIQKRIEHICIYT